MSIGELDIVLEEGLNKFNDDLKMHIDLKVSILNAFRSERRGGGLFRIEDFLPKSLIEKQVEISPEIQAKRWAAAGEEMMNAVEQPGQKRQLKRNVR